jgi:hypothetical protein
MYHLLLQDEIITDKVKENIECRIGAPASCIIKCLPWQVGFKELVKPIQNMQNQPLYHVFLVAFATKLIHNQQSLLAQGITFVKKHPK